MKGGFYTNRPRYEERQKQAAARQAAYDKLTPAEKLAKLDKGGFKAKKQRARLAKAAAAAPKVVEPAAQKLAAAVKAAKKAA